MNIAYNWDSFLAARIRARATDPQSARTFSLICSFQTSANSTRAVGFLPVVINPGRLLRDGATRCDDHRYANVWKAASTNWVAWWITSNIQCGLGFKYVERFQHIGRVGLMQINRVFCILVGPDECTYCPQEFRWWFVHAWICCNA